MMTWNFLFGWDKDGSENILYIASSEEDSENIEKAIIRGDRWIKLKKGDADIYLDMNQVKTIIKDEAKHAEDAPSAEEASQKG